MNPVLFANAASYCLQIGAVILAADVAARLSRMPPAAVRLHYWQLVLGAALALPLLQPWTAPPDRGARVEVRERLLALGSAIGADSDAAGVPWREALAAMYVTGVAGRLLWLTLGMARLHRLRARGRAFAHPCAGSVDVRVSGEVSSPVTFGGARPVILLPEALAAAGGPQLEAALAHESVHVRRRDWLFALGEEILRALLWFHPAIWWALAQIHLAREQAVDAESVAVTRSREQYLQALLAIAKSRLDPDLAPATPFLTRRHLRQRVEALLNEVVMPKQQLIFRFAASCAAVALAGSVAVRALPLEARAQESRQEQTQSTGQDQERKSARGGSGENRKAAPSKSTRGTDSAKKQEPAQQETPAAPPTVRPQNDPSLRAEDSTRQPTQIRVAGAVQQRNLLEKQPPVYPPEAKQAHIQGLVRLNVTIGRDGRVQNIELESGHPLLAEAAIDAVRQWVYRPTLLNGEPIEVLSQVDVNFTLRE